MSEQQFDENYLNLSGLGKLFDVTNQQVGRWLIDIGLRTNGKTPSQKALIEGFVKEAPTGRGFGNYYIWHRARTIHELEKAGHQRIGVEYVSDLVGPYLKRPCGTNCFEIVNSDSSVSVVVTGERNAAKLVRLMNVAHKHRCL